MGRYIAIGTGESAAFRGYLASPSRAVAPSIVVLQELFGVNADIRQTCDELADQGFLALAPDLFWRQRPGVDLDVRSEADWQTGLALYAAFDRDLGVKDVISAADVAAGLPGASGRIGLLGYCLGGLMTFIAAARSNVDAAVAFHGADTEKYLPEAAGITAPMLLHLAGEDEFMPPAAREAIAAAFRERPAVQVYCYAGCHHAFSRHNGAHYNASAAALAIGRTRAFFRDTLMTESSP